VIFLFLFSKKADRLREGSICLIQSVPRALSTGVNRPEDEAEHSTSCRADVQNEWSCTSTPIYVPSWRNSTC
jgi:hypothetical protein